jgi:hypothetical protein
MPTPVKGSLPKFLDVVDKQAKFFFLKYGKMNMFYKVTQVTK